MNQIDQFENIYTIYWNDLSLWRCKFIVKYVLIKTMWHVIINGNFYLFPRKIRFYLNGCSSIFSWCSQYSSPLLKFRILWYCVFWICLFPTNKIDFLNNNFVTNWKLHRWISTIPEKISKSLKNRKGFSCLSFHLSV